MLENFMLNRLALDLGLALKLALGLKPCLQAEALLWDFGLTLNLMPCFEPWALL